MSHGYSLMDVALGISAEAVVADRLEHGTDSIGDVVELGSTTWMESVGLCGACWACFDAFFDYEYKDESYIKSLVARQFRDSEVLLSLYQDDKKKGFLLK